MKAWFNALSRNSKFGFWLTITGMLLLTIAMIVRFVPDDLIGQSRESWYGWIFFLGWNLTTAGMVVQHRSKTTEETK